VEREEARPLPPVNVNVISTPEPWTNHIFVALNNSFRCYQSKNNACQQANWKPRRQTKGESLCGFWSSPRTPWFVLLLCKMHVSSYIEGFGRIDNVFPPREGAKTAVPFQWCHAQMASLVPGSISDQIYFRYRLFYLVGWDGREIIVVNADWRPPIWSEVEFLVGIEAWKHSSSEMCYRRFSCGALSSLDTRKT
jgi:hypothetical protein